MIRAIMGCAMLALAACGVDPMQPPLGELAATTLAGTVTLLQPVEGAQVCAYALKNDGRDAAPLGCGTTDAAGNWLVRAGTLHGPVVLEAQGATLTAPLYAVEFHVPQFAYVGPVHLTPIAHLTAAYAEALVAQRQAKPDEAIRQARVEMNRHFGALPHHLIRPWVAPQSEAGAGPLAITDAVQAHLFAAGIDSLARQWSAELGIAEETTVTLQSVLDVLYQDLRADGVLDGKGQGHQQLMQRDMALTGNALRYDLAVGMAQFLRSPRNQTGLAPVDIAPMLKAAAMSEGRIFDSPSQAYSDEKPKLSSCHVVTQDGQSSSLVYPQKGLIQIVCQWDDLSGITDARITIDAANADQAVTKLGVEDGAVSVLVDTHELLAATALHKKAFSFVVTAINVLGFDAHVRQQLHVDESSPTLKVTEQTAFWVHPAEPLRMAGEVDRPLRKVTLEPDGLASQNFERMIQEFRFEDSAKHFDITYPVEPKSGQTYTLRLVIEDWAGNQINRQVTSYCDTSPPAIHLVPSLFHQEFSGGIVDLSTHAAPFVLEKFYHTFDYLPEQGRDVASQNLPVLVFSVSDQDDSKVGTSADALRVEYSYVMGEDEAHRRNWAMLHPNDNGVYRLPLSYQTLLPESKQSVADNFIVRASPDALHRIVIRVTDLAGNVATQALDFHLHLKGPPVQMTDCTPTGALMGAGFAPPSFHWVYQDGFDLFDAHALYQLNLPQRSLAPWAPVNVAVSTPPLHSHIQKLTERWSKLATSKNDAHVMWHGRANIQNDMDAAVAASKHCGKGRRLGWGDGMCWPTKNALQFPHVRAHQVNYQSTQPLVVAALHAAPTSADTDASSSHIRLDPDRPLHLRTRMAGVFTLPTRVDGSTLDWARQVPWPDSGVAVVAKHLVGVEAEGDTLTYFERHFVVADLTMTRPGLQAEVSGAADCLPTPIRVDRDVSCAAPLRLSWDATGVTSALL